MKTKLLLTLSLATLSSCGGSNKSNLYIFTPTGAPAVAFYNHYNDSHLSTNNGDASNIIATMVNESSDIVVLPTNAGVQSIVKKNLNYKIAATITFGNLYIAATGNDENQTMDNDDYVVLFQQGQLPDLVFHSIYGTSLDNALHYVASAKEAAPCLKTGKNPTDSNKSVDYVLMAQPALYNVISTTPNRSIFKDLQKEYKATHDNMEMFQASVFVKNSLDKALIDSFLSNLKHDIENGLENPSLLKEGIDKFEDPINFIGVSGEVAKQVTENGNGMGLGFKMAYENKTQIDRFLEVFGLNETSEEIYYK